MMHPSKFLCAIALLAVGTISCATSSEGTSKTTSPTEQTAEPTPRDDDARAASRQIAVLKNMICVLDIPGSVTCAGASLAEPWSPEIDGDPISLLVVADRFVAQTASGELYAWRVQRRSRLRELLGLPRVPPEVDKAPTKLDFTPTFSEDNQVCVTEDGRVRCAQIARRGILDEESLLLEHHFADWSHTLNFECGVTLDAALICRGQNRWGELAVEPPDDRRLRTEVAQIELPSDSPIIDVETSGGHVCARTEAGELYCWGRNTHEQVGWSAPGCNRVVEPRLVELPSPASQVVLRKGITCALLEDHSVHCWGDVDAPEPKSRTYARAEQRDQLPECNPDELAPVDHIVLDGVNWASITADTEMLCGVTRDGDVACRGNLIGLPTPSMRTKFRPRAVFPTEITVPFVDLSLNGEGDICGVTKEGGLACETDGGETFNKKFAESLERRAPDTDKQPDTLYRAASSSNTQACMIDRDRKVRCFGSNSLGQIAQGPGVTLEREPTVVELGGAATNVDVGARHSCATREDGRVLCWGFNDRGQVGGEDLVVWKPRPVEAKARFVDVQVGRFHTCALDDQGAIWCWGAGDDGQLGMGERSSTREALRVDFDPEVTKLSVSPGNGCVLTAANEVWCWGDFYSEARSSDSPQRVELGSPARDVAAMINGGCAVLESDETVCWGGPYGDTPVEVADDFDVQSLCDSPLRVCLVTKDSAVLELAPYGARIEKWSDDAILIDALKPRGDRR